MKNRKFIFLLAICTVLAFGLCLSFGKNSVTPAGLASATPSPTPIEDWYVSVSSIPVEIRYLLAFQQVRDLNSKDKQKQAEGVTTYFKKSFYKDRLGLENQQAASVDTIIAECFSLIQPIDQRAHEVITQYRVQFPNGELKKPQPSPTQESEFYSFRPYRRTEPLPPIPAELNQLQQQKNQIIMSAREKIRLSLGDAKFAKFDGAVQQNAHNVLVPISPKDPRPVPTP